jgi:hypothetical protein
MKKLNYFLDKVSFKRVLSVSILVLIFILLILGFRAYLGNKLIYLLFTTVSTFSLFYGFREKSIFFDNFIAILLWLGFWFKFTIQISFLNSQFPEGVGLFDHKPSSYDKVLLISSVGLVSFSLASFLRNLFFNYQNIKFDNLDLSDIGNFLSSNKKKIIYLFIFIILSLGFLNFHFSFFQKGVIPKVGLPFGISNIFNWLLFFGFTSFFSILIFIFYLGNFRHKKNIIYLALLECFISSVSQLSRAMIFNGGSIIFGLYQALVKAGIEIRKSDILKLCLVLSILFILSLYVVSKLRQAKNFPIGHQVHSYLPTLSSSSNVIKMTNDLIKELNQVLFLVSGRWVGIEGIMTIVSNPDIGFSFFKRSFNEKFNYSNSFYENVVKKNIHSYEKKPPLFTVYVPGMIGYLYYTGSVFFLIISIIFVCFVCSYLEFFALRASKNNLIFCSLIGNILSYRVAHFGYMPINTYKILTAIILTIILVFFVMKLLGNIKK